jgi:hypothetical protein
MKEHIIQRIKINKQIVAIRVIMVADHGAKYSKQFVVNAHVTESEALNMAREYVVMMQTKPISIPSDEQVIAVAEDIVKTERVRHAHNEQVYQSVVKDVSFVLRRYATTRVFGYLNTSGEWSE